MPIFEPRRISSRPDWSDSDGVKIYTISTGNRAVDQSVYLARLTQMKKQRAIVWSSTPAFAIFHDGASAPYLILAWWGNGNELFTAVSVREHDGWVEDPAKYSFCIWDLDLIWHERNSFVELMYCETPNLQAYRARRFSQS